VLQILNGKPLVIHLKGMTVALMKGKWLKRSNALGMLTLRKNTFTLPNVPIGLLLPLTFPIEINNVGTANVSYKIQTREITPGYNLQNRLFLNARNFKIFDVKNQQGTLNPGERQYLYCLFRPLEQKVYEFLIIISVFDHSQQIDEIEVLFWFRST